MKRAGLIIGVFAMLLASCKSTKIDEVMISTIHATEIFSGELNSSGDRDPEQSVRQIESEDDWNIALTELRLTAEDIPDFDATGFDYNSANIYLFMDKLRGTLGHKISIAPAVLDQSTYTFKILVEKPTGPAAEVLNQPYSLFFVDKTFEDQKFMFIEQ